MNLEDSLPGSIAPHDFFPGLVLEIAQRQVSSNVASLYIQPRIYEVETRTRRARRAAVRQWPGSEPAMEIPSEPENSRRSRRSS